MCEQLGVPVGTGTAAAPEDSGGFGAAGKAGYSLRERDAEGLVNTP